MHLLVDVQGALSGSRHRGIGRYVSALTRALATNRGEHRLTLLANSAFPDGIERLAQDLAGLLPASEIVTFSALTPTEAVTPANALRRDVNELIREWAIARIAPDFVLVTSLFEGAIDDAVTSIGVFDTGIPTATVLYDLIPYLDPESYLFDDISRRWYFAKIASLRLSDVLLAISDSARSEAIHALNLPPERVTTIYSAADARFSKAAANSPVRANLCQRIGLRGPFVMNASAFEPRKNFEGLIRAFARLPRSLRAGYQLVLVSGMSLENQLKVRSLAAECGLGSDDVLLPGHLADNELIELYSSCSLFVFPSFHEGFGLPALEAMCCGAVVVGSNRTSVPEVIGRSDALFDPYSDDDIARVIQRALTDKAFRAALVDHNAEQVKKFSWDQTALRTLKALSDRPRGTVKPAPDVSGLLERIVATPSFATATRRDLANIATRISMTEKELLRWQNAAPRRYFDQEAGRSSAAETKGAPPVRTYGRTAALLSKSPSILMLKLDHIGDFIISLEAFHLIRSTWPEARLTLVCGPWNVELAQDSGLFDAVLACGFYAEAGSDYDRSQLMDEGLQAFRSLNLPKFDLAIDFRYYDDNRFLLANVDADLRAAYAGGGVRLDLSLPYDLEGDETSMGARTYALAAATARSFGPTSPESRRLILAGKRATRPFPDGRIVGIAPGTGNPIKAWGAMRFKQLVAILRDQDDYRFVVLGGPRDQEAAATICEDLPASICLNLAGLVAISDLGALVAGLDLYVGNDTGTTHMAAALGVPSICLFSGQSRVNIWRPIGDNVVTLKADVPCAPCHLTRIDACPYDHRCMDISPVQVAAAARTLLRTTAMQLSAAAR